jgi:hypothetical protein
MMSELPFKGDPTKILWSKSSPQEGDPTCLCSYCGKMIPENTVCLRCWRGEGPAMEEARFCDGCAETCFGMVTIPNEWDDYEEDGPQDLEDQLDQALDRAFPPR